MLFASVKVHIYDIQNFLHELLIIWGALSLFLLFWKDENRAQLIGNADYK